MITFFGEGKSLGKKIMENQDYPYLTGKNQKSIRNKANHNSPFSILNPNNSQFNNKERDETVF